MYYKKLQPRLVVEVVAKNHIWFLLRLRIMMPMQT